MFADQTLTPKEALRLCALGTVAAMPARYSALASAVRHFCGRVMGPSLDVMGPPIELLRYEGLVVALDGEGLGDDDALLAITDAGLRELRTLLTARVRPSSDLSKLVVALKFRFLHLLDTTEQAEQIEMLRDASESELARLEDLRAAETVAGSAFAAWLDHDLALLRQRIAWLESFAPTSEAAATETG